MTQFDQQQFGMGAEPPRTSGLAICSLIFSFLLPPLGLVLGILALMSIRSNAPRLGGKGMAIAGMIVGAVMSVGCGVGGFCLYVAGTKFAQMIVMITEGAPDTMDAIMGGDFTTARGNFTGPAATATNAEFQAFADALTARHGAYVSTTVGANSSSQPPSGQATVPFPVTIQFANGSVTATFNLVFMDQNGAIVNKFDGIVVRDATLGDIVFP